MRSFPLPVMVGDLVRIDTEFLSKKPFESVVLDVERRYGRVNHGRDKTNPLITVFNPHTKETEHYDTLWVAEVLQRAPLKWRPPKNIYSHEWTNEHVEHPSRGLWKGRLYNLVAYGLSRLSLEMLTPLHDSRIPHLWLRHRCPGLVVAEPQYPDPWGEVSKMTNGFLTVRKKPFMSWVRRNATRLCNTAKEFDAFITRQNTSWEREYEDEMRRELMADWRDDDLDGQDCFDDYDDYTGRYDEY